MCFLIALGVLLPSVFLVRNFLGNFLGSVPEILEKNLEDHDQGDVQDRVGGQRSRTSVIGFGVVFNARHVSHDVEERSGGGFGVAGEVNLDEAFG